MKKSIYVILIFTFTLVGLQAMAQKDDAYYFTKYLKKGNDLQKKKEYYDAILQYTVANAYTKLDEEKKAIDDNIHICAEALIKQKKEAENAELRAKKSEKAALEALEKAEVLQNKLEIAFFDQVINERNKNWKTFDYYEFEKSNNKHAKQGNEILSKIDTLDFSKSSLVVIGPQFKFCNSLKVIILLNHYDLNINTIINQLNPQTSIWISTNNYNSISEDNLKHITGLETDYNLITSNSSILEQKQLRYLKCTKKNITRAYLENNSLPLAFFQLNKLEYLSLHYCDINSIQKNIGELKDLKYLDLSKNTFTELPNEIAKLSKLEYLNLNSCKLPLFPIEIFQFSQLKTLKFNNSVFTNLPSQIGNLKNLTTLDLSYSQVDTIPKEIGELSKLTNLELQYTRVKNIPHEIGGLKNLTSLNLSNCDLNSIPDEIWTLKKLINLNLDQTNLKTFPTKLGELSNLKTFNMNIDSIQTIPASFYDLPISNQINYENWVYSCFEFNKYELAKSIRKGISNKQLKADMYALVARYLVFCNDFEGALIFADKYVAVQNENNKSFKKVCIVYLYAGDLEKATRYYQQVKVKDKKFLIYDLENFKNDNINAKNSDDVKKISQLLSE